MAFGRVDFESLSAAEKFRGFCRLMCELSGLQLVFVDPADTRRQPLGGQAASSPLCAHLRRRRSFAKLCAECDRVHLERAAGGTPGRSYVCHAGLIDLVVPVRIDGRHVGSFMGGQVLPRPPTGKRFEQFWKPVARHGCGRARTRQLYFATPSVSQSRLRTLVQAISLFAAHFGELGSRVLESASPAGSPVEWACAFIDEHLTESFTLEDAARAAGVTPSYLSGLFRRELGETFVARVRRLRVERARKLLAESDQGMLRIALDSGFGSLRSFNRAFRMVTGETPSTARKGLLCMPLSSRFVPES
jgi:AraC-like DNA-binding protein